MTQQSLPPQFQLFIPSFPKLQGTAVFQCLTRKKETKHVSDAFHFLLCYSWNWLLFILICGTDRIYCILNEWKPLRTKKEHVTCYCFRGPTAQQTDTRKWEITTIWKNNNSSKESTVNHIQKYTHENSEKTHS